MDLADILPCRGPGCDNPELNCGILAGLTCFFDVRRLAIEEIVRRLFHRCAS